MSKTKPARAVLGSSFDDLLKETGDFDAVNEAALKRVLAWQLEQAREAQGVSKAALAARMNTSRSQLSRLLDPDNEDVTLAAMKRLAAALGRAIKLELGERLAPVKVKRKLPMHGGQIKRVALAKGAVTAKAARKQRKPSTSVRAVKCG